MFTFTMLGQEYSVKFKIKALLFYESMTGHTFSIGSMMDSVMLFYAFILANYPEFNLNPDEFMDAMDETPGILTKFNLWLAKEQERQAMLAGADENDAKDKKKVKSRSKNSTK